MGRIELLPHRRASDRARAAGGAAGAGGGWDGSRRPERGRAGGAGGADEGEACPTGGGGRGGAGGGGDAGVERAAARLGESRGQLQCQALLPGAARPDSSPGLARPLAAPVPVIGPSPRQCQLLNASYWPGGHRPTPTALKHATGGVLEIVCVESRQK